MSSRIICGFPNPFYHQLCKRLEFNSMLFFRSYGNPPPEEERGKTTPSRRREPASASLRCGRETGKSLSEVGQVVSFGAEVANSDGLRADPKGAEAAAEACGGYGLIAVV